MKKVSAFILFCLCACTPGVVKNERYYQEKWCARYQGQMEVVMPDKTRCDCLTDKYAVEFDFAAKWAESIPQALNYSLQTGKRPGVVIICEKKKDLEKFLKVKKLNKIYKLKVKVWGINCG